ncbi:hypothetical protein EIN_428730 [Entamoeba invadens IP1]|uniref:WWE domain-containing protein n=1 Tax=Entamoeba invadens IP1 TaxID=370355 RepID=A0A0A1UHD8_ENTIV|nr:hypothetical protein EIN_428730 [Entamoeba invadens IP1]ELP95147.1 hypothetical protein EIN_428730 [Entamoeba invadens IP1]|eukprot:XP_004261918.1 hypothetical protein EIN_428730 [Entamoeba invadens IP1]
MSLEPSEATIYFQWEWEEEKGFLFSSSWTPYHRNENQQLEEHYQQFLDEIYVGPVDLQNVPQKKKLVVGDYEIDFKNLKQINKITTFTRNIRRVRKEVIWGPARWCYSGKRCTKEFSDLLETLYKGFLNGGKEIVQVELGKNKNLYEIDFTAFVQKNLTTQTYRKLSRIDENNEPIVDK